MGSRPIIRVTVEMLSVLDPDRVWIDLERANQHSYTCYSFCSQLIYSFSSTYPYSSYFICEQYKLGWKLKDITENSESENIMRQTSLRKLSV